MVSTANWYNIEVSTANFSAVNTIWKFPSANTIWKFPSAWFIMWRTLLWHHFPRPPNPRPEFVGSKKIFLWKISKSSDFGGLTLLPLSCYLISSKIAQKIEIPLVNPPVNFDRENKVGELWKSKIEVAGFNQALEILQWPLLTPVNTLNTPSTSKFMIFSSTTKFGSIGVILPQKPVFPDLFRPWAAFYQKTLEIIFCAKFAWHWEKI